MEKDNKGLDVKGVRNLKSHNVSSESDLVATPASIMHITTSSSDTNDLEQFQQPNGPYSSLDPATKIVHKFLVKHAPEFARVIHFRNRGWIDNKEKGDEFFKAQRDRADNADAAARKLFHGMMLQIATEMQNATRALKVEGTRPDKMKVLDICMAPGGYADAVLRYNPQAQVFGITLPEEIGGHSIIIDKRRLSGLSLVDVTLLLNEFTDKPVPESYPNKSSFLLTRPFKFHQFDLIFCDGKVLRTHDRPKVREQTEASRLLHSQLILALQRIRPGGTLVMLLHKVEQWATMCILFAFDKFSKIQLFKPKKKHGTRSSFYLIAKDIQPGSTEAKKAVQAWRNTWWTTTFGGPDTSGHELHIDLGSVVTL